jgi:hypothetical protein
MNELSGATSLPFNTTVHPAAMAAPALRQIIFSGTFHGVMAPTTPAGTRLTVAFPTCSSQTISRATWAITLRSSMAPPVCPATAIFLGMPTSRTMVSVISSDRAVRASANAVINSRRSSRDVPDQPSRAIAAASTARPASSDDPAGTVAIASSVAGLMTEITPSPEESAHFPLMKI